MANICRGLRKKFFCSPVLKSPTNIGFIGVKKNGSKISHLGTFKKITEKENNVDIAIRQLNPNQLGDSSVGIAGGSASTLPTPFILR